MNAPHFIDADDSVFSTSAHTMHTDLMGIITRTCKALPNVWQKMSSDQQQDFGTHKLAGQTVDMVEESE